MDDVPAAGTSAINDIDLSLITPNPDQPRRDFDEESIAELAASIRELGIIQPLSLRKTGPNAYQIIAGERRYRAARLAGLQKVPAYIRTVSDTELTEMALIENIQREDLNPIEIALTLRKLIDQYKLTQERLSERIGMKRTTIANFMRLINLPAEVQLGLRDTCRPAGSLQTHTQGRPVGKKSRSHSQGTAKRLPNEEGQGSSTCQPRLRHTARPSVSPLQDTGAVYHGPTRTRTHHHPV